MIPEKLKDLWPLIYTWLNGGRVQIKIISDWRDVQSISDFKNFNNEFRVYSEPKLVQFKFEDNKLLQGKYICRNGFTAMYKIIGIDQNGVSLIHSGKFEDINYNDLFISYCFSDGSPCGKYIE